MRRKDVKRALPAAWYVPVEIDVVELGDFITDSEFRYFSAVCPVIKINLHFNYTAADPEVGIMNDSFEWDGEWSLPNVGNYPQKLKDAITSFLGSIDVDERWADSASEKADLFIESILYQDV